MSFMLYIFGLIVLLCGLIYGATLLNIPQQWIAVGAVIVAGLGILSAVAQTRSKDKPT
jgi:positive regulator of sigma E activity